jgi:hypothetical protein
MLREPNHHPPASVNVQTYLENNDLTCDISVHRRLWACVGSALKVGIFIGIASLPTNGYQHAPDWKSARPSLVPVSSSSRTAAGCNCGSCRTARSAGASPIDLRAGNNCSPSGSIQRPASAKRARRGKTLSGSWQTEKTLRSPRSWLRPQKPPHPPTLSTPSPVNYWTRSGARRRPNGPWPSSNGF